jgi:hypothetical protein
MTILQTIKTAVSNVLFAGTRCDVCGKHMTDTQVTVCDNSHCQFEYYKAGEFASSMDYGGGPFNGLLGDEEDYSKY